MAENKERIIGTERVSERGQTPPMTEIRRHPEQVSPEIKTWMQRIEEDPMNMRPVDDTSGQQQIMQPMASQNPKIVLPVTKTTFVAGFKKKVGDAGKWLSIFILRVIKLKKGNVRFKEEGV